MSDNNLGLNLLCGRAESGLTAADLQYAYLASQYAELARANTELNAKIEIRDEIICLYGEALKRPEQGDALLTRISMLMEK